MGFPDPEALKKILNKLDLIVSVTFSWSDTAWFSDVVLPLSPYLERESILACKNGLKPYFFVRRRALEPRFDTRADWEILGGLAKRLDLAPLSFRSIEEIWNYQLMAPGFYGEFCSHWMVHGRKASIASRTNSPNPRQDRNPDRRLKNSGLPSLKPYEPPVNGVRASSARIWSLPGAHPGTHCE
jgi:thiosulfate reductase/polysulfide reductase chain A